MTREAYAEQRHTMVETQIVARGVRDAAVLAAMRRVPREAFVEPALAACAGNGTLGWPEHAPYDGIVVTASGPEIPQALQAQLALGGRLVMPVGMQVRYQTLIRVTRESETEFRQEDLEYVCFVPLIGAQGWPEYTPGGDKGARDARGFEEPRGP